MTAWVIWAQTMLFRCQHSFGAAQWQGIAWMCISCVCLRTDVSGGRGVVLKPASSNTVCSGRAKGTSDNCLCLPKLSLSIALNTAATFLLLRRTPALFIYLMSSSWTHMEITILFFRFSESALEMLPDRIWIVCKIHEHISADVRLWK